MLLKLLGLDSIPIFPFVIFLLSLLVFFLQEHSPDNDTSQWVLAFANYPYYFMDGAIHELPSKSTIDPVTGEIEKLTCPLIVKDGAVTYKSQTVDIPPIFKINKDGLLEYKNICGQNATEPVNWLNLTLYYQKLYGVYLPDTQVDNVVAHFIFTCSDGKAMLVKK